uniref:Uncharacterized protein n=1 Tax=Anguilla anguilla TaxID=7936 RepID=A0A0E9SEF9_ANGAN
MSGRITSRPSGML